MQKLLTYNLTSSLIKAFAFSIGVIVFIWFMYSVISIVLIFLLAIVFAVIINAPVTWLERKKLSRGLATFLIFLSVFLLFGLFGWLIVPLVNTQLKGLINNLPDYTGKIERILSNWRAEYFHWTRQAPPSGNTYPNLSTLLKLGDFSISLFGSAVLFLVLVSLTAYMVIYPRPLLQFYLSLFPVQQRDKAQNAFMKTATMLIGWMRANLIGGAIESVCVVIFLNIMNIPGAWVWGILALLAQMIPKVGFYVMALPPTLISFSISPLTALWVFIFFLVIGEILGDFVMPRLRATSMNLHPVMIMICILVMGAAFGFIGILLSTPIAAFLKSMYEEFYLTRFQTDEKMEQRVETMIDKSKSLAA